MLSAQKIVLCKSLQIYIDPVKHNANHFDRIHRNENNRFFLVEYWHSKEDKDRMESSKEHQLFHEHRKLIIEEKYETYECDIVI